MPIDPSAVRWDPIDPAKVRWEGPSTDEDKKKLAEGTSVGDAAVVGAGRIGDRMLEGLKQSGLGIGAIFSEILPERLKRAAQEEIAKRLIAQEKQQKSNDQEYKALSEAHPIATGIGEAVPVVAAPMLRVAEGAGALPAIVNAAVSSAAPAALEYGTAAERGKAGAAAGISGAVGSGVTSAAGKVIGGIRNSLTPEAQRLAALAEERFNIPLDAAQKTGNKALQVADAAFDAMPATAGAQAVKKGAQKDAFTREVMKTLGETAEEATPATLQAAAGRIGGDFERVFSKTHINLDQADVQTSLAKVVQNAAETLPQEQAAVVVKRVSQLLDKIDDNGAVAGKAYQAWRSSVQKQAKESSDKYLGSSLRDLYRAVDDVAYKAAADVGEEGALRTARSQYRNMKTIEPLIAKSEDGTISPKLLRGEVMKHNPDYAKSNDDLVELARIGRKFIADQVPTSGTSERQMAQALLTGGMMGGAGWAASGDPLTGAKFAAGGLLMPKVAQSVLNSGAAQRFLSSGGRELTPLEMALMDRAARIAALGTANAASQ